MEFYEFSNPIADNFVIDVDQGVIGGKANKVIQQGEHDARYLQVELVQNGVPVDLTNCDVYFLTRSTKSNTKPTMTLCEIFDPERGNVKVQVKNYMTNKDGVIECEFVRIGHDKTILPFKKFNLTVDGSIYTDDAIESSEPLHALVDALATVREVEQLLGSEFMDLEAKYAGELSKTNAQLSQKANYNEVIKKGDGTLNDFDEETRRIILGLEQGEINAVLGDNNVSKDNLRHNIVDADILSKEYNMFNASLALKGKVVIGENPDATINIGRNDNNSVYSLPIPQKGILRISVIEPTTGQFITYMKEDKVVSRATYNQVIAGGADKPLRHSPVKYDAETNDLILYCERLSATVDIIYLTILNSEFDNFYIKGQHVFSLRELEWVEESNPNIDVIFANDLNTELNNDILISEKKRLIGYDLVTLEPVFENAFGYMNFSLKVAKYKNSILTVGGVENITEYPGQRFMYLDDKGKVLAHYTFAQTNDVHKLNIMKIRQQYPTVAEILVSIPFDDYNNICNGYISNQTFDSCLDGALTNLKNTYEDLWDTDLIVHNKKITGFDIATGAILSEQSDNYFYAVMDIPKKGDIEIPIAQNTLCQLLLLLDENEAFINVYSPTMLNNGSKGWLEYEVGADSFTLKCDKLPTKTTKIAISFRYDYHKYYIKGTGTMQLSSVLGLNTTELDKPIHKFVLPPKFVIVEGVESTIYFNNVVRYVDTDKIANITASGCDSKTSRYVRYKRNSTGDISCTINLQSLNGNSTYLSKTIKGVCIPKNSGTGLSKKVLFIGDSLTDATVYAREIINLFSKDVMNVELLGTRGSGEARHEGRSGWRAWEYVNLSDGEFGYSGTNEFYNPTKQKFDFAYYMNKHSYANVDYVFINLGTNDLGRNHHNTDEDIIESYNFMINNIKNFNPNVKILLWLPPTRALGMIGTNKSDINYSLRANQLFIDVYGNRENENIFLVPVYFNIDPYHDYNYQEVNVSDRNSNFKELKCTDTVHPATEGYYKIADVIYAWIKYMAYLETH